MNIKDPSLNPEGYENERKRLEKKKWTLNYFLFSMRLFCKLKKENYGKKSYMIWFQPPGKTHPPI